MENEMMQEQKNVDEFGDNITHSAELKDLAGALAKFHLNVGKVTKNAENPFYKKAYGDINSYLDVIRQPLADAGLSIVQLPITGGLTTMLIHTSGQWISSTLYMKPMKNDPQGVGASLTYARRYMLAGFLSLSADDDDGNEASGLSADPGKAPGKAPAKKGRGKKQPENLAVSPEDIFKNLQESLKILQWSREETVQFSRGIIPNFASWNNASHAEQYQIMIAIKAEADKNAKTKK